MQPLSRQNRRLVATLAVMLAAAIAIRFAVSDGEPRFEGRKLSAWLDDPALPATEIERGVRAIGTNALLHLQTWLIDQPSLLERAIRELDERVDYIGIGYHPSIDANFRAMRGFLALGELASPAVPWLEAGAAGRDANFEFYLKALVVCGPSGWQAIDRLESTNTSGTWTSFLNALAFGVERSPESADRLARYLEHPDLKTRREAYQTIRLLRDRCPPELLARLAAGARGEPDPALRELGHVYAAELAKDQPGDPPRDVIGQTK